LDSEHACNCWLRRANELSDTGHGLAVQVQPNDLGLERRIDPCPAINHDAGPQQVSFDRHVVDAVLPDQALDAGSSLVVTNQLGCPLAAQPTLLLLAWASWQSGLNLKGQQRW
jgi:hypothetical protein